ncbi:MAG: aldo/keto reductase [Clostridiales bacterium]|nr:aldo/keto reductase [Clostridiales bacterium]
MNYRPLGNTGMMVSEVGFGAEHLEGMDFDRVDAIVNGCLDRGINMMDCFMAEPNVRSNIGKALGSRRQKMHIQGHIGSIWEGGQYHRSRDAEKSRIAFEDILKRMNTDYMDVGMIHYVDTPEDYERLLKSGLLEYAQKLKKDGTIRAIGVSSHDPATALKLIKSGIIEVLMFSINPAYDLMDETTTVGELISGEKGLGDANGIHSARQELYKACESLGVGITVMKPYGAGKLLNAELSPFKTAMTTSQCIHYCLTRPAVASVLCGYRSVEDIIGSVAYEEADANERDYSPFLSATKRFSMEGNCMYCNHCLPCPSLIDIASVNKFLDLALAAEGSIPQSVKEHYLGLSAHGSDCIGCKSCEGNCPFGVPVTERMAKAAEIFGK